MKSLCPYLALSSEKTFHIHPVNVIVTLFVHFYMILINFNGLFLSSSPSAVPPARLSSSFPLLPAARKKARRSPTPDKKRPNIRKAKRDFFTNSLLFSGAPNVGKRFGDYENYGRGLFRWLVACMLAWQAVIVLSLADARHLRIKHKKWWKNVWEAWIMWREAFYFLPKYAPKFLNLQGLHCSAD